MWVCIGACVSVYVCEHRMHVCGVCGMYVYMCVCMNICMHRCICMYMSVSGIFLDCSLYLYLSLEPQVHWFA